MAADAMGSVLVRAWSRSARLQAGLEGRGYTDNLVTLTVPRPASPGFLTAGILTVAGVWLAVLVASQIGAAG